MTILFVVGESSRLNTKDTLLTVEHLEKYQNYTMEVAAVTKAGEGVRSRPVYCRTMEDIPSTPANIKAVPVSGHSILVSWLPPSVAAGEITGYAIHISTMMAGQPITDKIDVFNTASLQYLVSGLVANQPYSICVTAFTMVGEGPCSGVVVETPRSPHLPTISSLPFHYHALLSSSISLPCKALGNPSPVTSWTLK